MTAARSERGVRLRNRDQKPSSIRSMGSQIGSTLPRPINDQELLFHEQAVGDDGLGTTGSQEFGQRCQKVCENQKQVLHDSAG